MIRRDDQGRIRWTGSNAGWDDYRRAEDPAKPSITDDDLRALGIDPKSIEPPTPPGQPAKT